MRIVCNKMQSNADEDSHPPTPGSEETMPLHRMSRYLGRGPIIQLRTPHEDEEAFWDDRLRHEAPPFSISPSGSDVGEQVSLDDLEAQKSNKKKRISLPGDSASPSEVRKVIERMMLQHGLEMYEANRIAAKWTKVQVVSSGNGLRHSIVRSSALRTDG